MKNYEDNLENRSNNSLSNWNNRIIQSGLRVANQLQLSTHHTFSDHELDYFIHKFNDLRDRFNTIPSEFEELPTNNPHKVTGAFDPNLYFDVFSKIQILEGFVLDYVYVNYSEPLLYARRKTDPPFDNLHEFFSYLKCEQPNIFLGDLTTFNGKHDYYRYLIFEKSFLGYFQFAIFCLKSDHFYRYDHGCYGMSKIILTENGFNEFIRTQNLIDKQRKELLLVDYHPTVTIENQVATVNIFSYDPISGGLDILEVMVKHPNQLLNVFHKPIIKGTPYFL